MLLTVRDNGRSARQRKEDLVSAARRHIAAEPAIYLSAQSGIAMATRQVGFPPQVEDAVLDLKGAVPLLNNRQISELIGVAESFVRGVILADAEDFFPDDNQAASAAHLYLLRASHPGRIYEDAPQSIEECAGQGLPKKARTIHTQLP